MPQKYPRPPIIEAVLHVRFAAPFSDGELKRFPRLLEPQYPKATEETDFQLALEVREGAPPVPRQNTTDHGVRLMGQEDQRVIVARSGHVLFSYLAPYPGWDHFSDSARYVFDTLREKLGYRKVTTVGLRYVNRLDVPTAESQMVQIQDYLRIGIVVPENGVSATIRSLQALVEMDLNHDKLIARITVGTMESPLIQHASLLFDIDIIAQNDVPARVEDFWELVGRMRDDKNAIFESGVTDKARALWQK